MSTLAPAELFYIAVGALKEVSRRDPASPRCSSNAPQNCENSCIGCIARAALQKLGMFPSWPDVEKEEAASTRALHAKLTLEDITTALDYASEGRDWRGVKPDLLGNQLNRVLARLADKVPIMLVQVETFVQRRRAEYAEIASQSNKRGLEAKKLSAECRELAYFDVLKEIERLRL